MGLPSEQLLPRRRSQLLLLPLVRGRSASRTRSPSGLTPGEGAREKLASLTDRQRCPNLMRPSLRPSQCYCIPSLTCNLKLFFRIVEILFSYDNVFIFYMMPP